MNPQLFPADLDVMYKATEGKIGTDEAALINLVMQRSADHCAQLNDAYKAKSKGGKSTFLEVLAAETSFSFKRTLEAAFHDKIAWHARSIYEATVGKKLATSESCLIHNLLLPNAYEVQRIVKRLADHHKVDLLKTIKAETSGNLEKILCKHVETCLAP